MKKDIITKALRTEPEFEIPQDFSASVLKKIKQREQTSLWTDFIWMAASIVALVLCCFLGLYFTLGLDFLATLYPYLGWGALMLLMAVPIQLLDPMAKSKFHIHDKI